MAKIERIDKGLYRRRGRGAGKRKDENDYIRETAIQELQDLRDLERPILVGASIEDIEGLLVTIAEVSGVEGRAIQPVKSAFGGAFIIKQRTKIYEVLLKVVERIPSKWARRQFAERPFWARHRIREKVNPATWPSLAAAQPL